MGCWRTTSLRVPMPRGAEMSADFLLWLVALICFACAAGNVASPRVNLGWLGAFFIALSVVLHGAHAG